MKTLCLVVLSSFVCLVPFGCRQTDNTVTQKPSSTATTKTPKQPQNAKVQSGKSNAAPVKVANAKTATKENGRPTPKASLKDFPKDVPLYPGAKVLGVGKSDRGVVAGLESKDAPQKVLEFYQHKLGAQGWFMKSATTTKQGGLLEAHKKPRQCIVTVGFNPKTKVTAFSLTVVNG